MTTIDLTAAEGLFVLETTDGDAFIGQLGLTSDTVVVRNGFVGRPRVVPRDQVLAIVPAAEHPDVVLV